MLFFETQCSFPPMQRNGLACFLTQTSTQASTQQTQWTEATQGLKRKNRNNVYSYCVCRLWILCVIYVASIALDGDGN